MEVLLFISKIYLTVLILKLAYSMYIHGIKTGFSKWNNDNGDNL